MFEDFEVEDVGTLFEAHAPAVAPLRDVLVRNVSVASAQQTVVLENVRGLRFENVSFVYPGSEEPALSGVNLHLRPGQSLALVGENGSGKTTLIKLLTRLYQPSEGRVLLDGLDLREWDAESLRRRIGAQGTLSFGDAELLMAHLGVIPGAVTPFAVINDRAGNVTMVLDKELQAGTLVNAHPLRNDRTSAIGADDLVRFLEAEGHSPLIIDFASKDEE